MPNPPEPMVQFDTLVLERLKFAARQHLGPQVQHDLEARAMVDRLTDRMVLDLETHLYAHKVDAQDVTVPFSKTEAVRWQAPVRRLWVLWGIAALGTALAIAFASLPVLALAFATALAWVVVYASNPPQEETLTVAGHAVVRREQFNAFPDNERVYPKSLGGRVQIAMIQDSYARYAE